jgi:hypothetical protein
MRPLLLAVLPAFCLIHLFPLEAVAQQPRLQVSSDKQYKVKNKGGVERTRDKSKPVRAALEAQYAKIAEAYRNDAPELVLELRTPDFSVQMPSGERWDAEQSAAYVRAGFEQVERTLSLSFTIEELSVRGDTAAALIHQRWSRMQMKRGQARRVETSACQRETWVNTAEGWRLHLIDSIQPLVWVVDGKRVDPSKPYDPDAPPYSPDVEMKSPCTA